MKIRDEEKKQREGTKGQDQEGSTKNQLTGAQEGRMKRTALALLVFTALPWLFLTAAQAGPKKSNEGDQGRQEMTVKVLEGKLTGYGKHFVEVDGQKFLLCKKCAVLDELENPITTEGLVATDSVKVTVTGECATEVMVTITKK
jgi:hypothetical protein